MPSLEAKVSNIREISCMLVALLILLLISFNVKFSVLSTSSETQACKVVLKTLRTLPECADCKAALLFINSHLEWEGKRLESSKIVGLTL